MSERERDYPGGDRIVEGNVVFLASPSGAVGPVITECMIYAGIGALIEEEWRDDCVALVSAIYRAMWHRSAESGSPEKTGDRPAFARSAQIPQSP